jgi:dGTPase
MNAENKKMTWEKLLNTKRLGDRIAKIENGRSPFSADHDKVIFSGSFRRLARKTQVHPLATNDLVHNRLTHSLEVASVGRTLATRVGESLDEREKLPKGMKPTDLGDIVQAACLAHDIGNPPFGHTGEEAIKYWFQNEEGVKYLSDLNPNEVCDLQNFEGNAQGLRVLTCTEFHPYDGGLRLTYASLGAFIKYPWTSVPAISGQRPKSNKYGIYQSEKIIFQEIADAVGLLPSPGDNWYCRHPLVNIMEIADDFCYALLDLEDGIDMGIISWDDVFSILKLVLDKTKIEKLNEEVGKLKPNRRSPLVRGKVISAFIESASKAFIEKEEGFLTGKHKELLPLCDNSVIECVNAAKKLAKEKVFSHPRKIELEIGAYNTIGTLLKVMCHSVDEFITYKKVKNFRSNRVLELIGEGTFHPDLHSPDKCQNSPRYLGLMRVLDFVSGMTDNYATHLAKQFSGMGDVR